MKVSELKAFLNTIDNDEKEIFFCSENNNPFGDGTVSIENVFEVSEDWMNTGAYEGVYLKGN